MSQIYAEWCAEKNGKDRFTDCLMQAIAVALFSPSYRGCKKKSRDQPGFSIKQAHQSAYAVSFFCGVRWCQVVLPGATAVTVS